MKFNIEDVFQSKLFRAVILGTTGLIILALVFGLGVFAGQKRANFSFRWADSYHRNFGGPQGGIFGEFTGMDKEFTNSNGCFGQIISVDEENGILTIKDARNVEKSIVATSKAPILLQRKIIEFSELNVGDSVVVIGEPNDSGQIEAGLIRVIPPPKLTPSVQILPDSEDHLRGSIPNLQN
jgi:hypothetical protein